MVCLELTWFGAKWGEGDKAGNKDVKTRRSLQCAGRDPGEELCVLRYSQLQLAQGDALPGAVTKEHHLFHPVVGLQCLDPGFPGTASSSQGHKSPMGA